MATRNSAIMDQPNQQSTVSDDPPEILRDWLQEYLGPGESVLWWGKPVPSAVLGRWLVLHGGGQLSGLVVLGLLLAAAAMALHLDLLLVPGWLLGACLILIIGGGIHFLFRLWWTWRQAGRTFYVITSRRAILAELVAFGRRLTLDAEHLEEVSSVERSDGGGEIYLLPRDANPPHSRDVLGLLGLRHLALAKAALEQMRASVSKKAVPAPRIGIATSESASSAPVKLDLAPGLAQQVAEILEPGERILWLGQPCSRLLVQGDVLLVVTQLMGIGCLGLLLAVIGWVVPVAGILWWILGGMFAFLGVSLVAAPSSAKWRARRTAYLVTDRRALIVQGYRGGRTYSYFPGELNGPTIRRLADGTGELVLERRPATSSHQGGAEQSVVGFLCLERVNEAGIAVELLLGRRLPVEQVAALSLDQNPI